MPAEGAPNPDLENAQIGAPEYVIPVALKANKAAPHGSAGAGSSRTGSEAQQAREDYLTEVKDKGIDAERKWLREKIEEIEATTYSSDSRIHQKIIQELTRVSPIMSLEVSQEFMARKAFHDFYLAFAISQSAEKLPEIARGVTNETIDTMFKLRGENNQPVFANAFRALETLGNEFVLAKDTGVQRNKTELRMVASWMATGLDRAQSEQKVTQEGKGSSEMWASSIAEKLWYASGRAAYYDAYNSDATQRLKGDSKGFQKNLFNFRKYLGDKKLGAPFLRDEDKDGHPISDGGSQILQTGSVDFFSQLGPDFDGPANTTHDHDTNFVTSLAAVKLEDVDFLSATTVTSFADNIESYDKAGLFIADSKDTAGFLHTLDQHTLAKLLANKLYSHLKGDERDLAILSAVELIIEYQRKRPEFKNKSVAQLEAYSPEAAKKIYPWDNTEINQQVSYFGQYIKNHTILGNFRSDIVNEDAVTRAKHQKQLGKAGSIVGNTLASLFKYALSGKGK